MYSGTKIEASKRGVSLFAVAALAMTLGLSGLTGKTGASARETRTASTGQAKVPADLVGQWKWGTISSLSYEDVRTGKNLGPGRGMMVFFTFEKSGKYKMFFAVQTRTYDWTMQTYTDEEGTVTFDGSTFTLQPTSGKYKSSDNRVQKNNFNRPMTKEELKKARRVYHWKWEKNDDNGKTYLMMGPTESSRSPFQPMK